MKFFSSCVSFTLCFHVITQTSFSQQIIDSAVLKVTYSYSYLLDSTSGQRVLNEPMILMVGRNTSKFYSELRSFGDSLLMKRINKGFSSIKEGGEEFSKSIYYQNKPALILYQNYPLSTLTYRDRLNKHYEYIDSLNTQKWTLLDETDSIMGYECQKASTSYGGRLYKAWFCSTIPIPFGPWKFYGLPGLIFRIREDSDKFIFECTSIVPSSEIISLDRPLMQYTRISKQAFLKAQFLYRTQPWLAMQQDGVVIKSIVNADGSEEDLNKLFSRKKPFVPIEFY